MATVRRHVVARNGLIAQPRDRRLGQRARVPTVKRFKSPKRTCGRDLAVVLEVLVVHGLELGKLSENESGYFLVGKGLHRSPQYCDSGSQRNGPSPHERLRKDGPES